MSVDDATNEVNAIVRGRALESVELQRRANRRVEYLNAIIAGGNPGEWVDLVATKDNCLELHAQLVSLAIGRAYIRDITHIQERIDTLRASLLAAGYEFDDVGYEEKWDEKGNVREGYTPLTE